MENLLNGCRIIARARDAVYIRIPAELQASSSFGTPCTCGDCDGSGKWDTLVVPTPTVASRNDHTYTVHLPDKGIAGFVEYLAKRDQDAKRTVKIAATQRPQGQY